MNTATISFRSLHLYATIILVASFTFYGCKKDKDPEPVIPATAVINFNFVNEVDAQQLAVGNLGYTNEAGNVYSVDLLKYYISNIVFVKDDNSLHYAPNYELIDESKSESKSFSMVIPTGNYKELRFFMGVDSLKNVSGAQSGALDPSYGMFWDWNTGYIYFKHEGNFIDPNGDTLPIVYHFGSFDALVKQEHSLNFEAGSTPRTIQITFNLNQLYRSPNVIDFTNNNIHSGGSQFVNSLRENFADAFEVNLIE